MIAFIFDLFFRVYLFIFKKYRFEFRAIILIALTFHNQLKQKPLMIICTYPSFSTLVDLHKSLSNFINNFVMQITAEFLGN